MPGKQKKLKQAKFFEKLKGNQKRGGTQKEKADIHWYLPIANTKAIGEMTAWNTKIKIKIIEILIKKYWKKND